MQLQPNSTTNKGSGARTPPQPLVQTPVGATSQSHSRSSSHSSMQSSKNSLSATTTAPPPTTSQTLVKEMKSNEIKS